MADPVRHVVAAGRVPQPSSGSRTADSFFSFFMPSGSKKGAAANGHAAAPFSLSVPSMDKGKHGLTGRNTLILWGPLPMYALRFPLSTAFLLRQSCETPAGDEFSGDLGLVFAAQVSCIGIFPSLPPSDTLWSETLPANTKRTKAPERHAVRRVFLCQPRVSSLLHILPPVHRRYTLSAYIPPPYPLLPHTHPPLRPPVSPIYFLPHGRRLHRTFLRACRLCPRPLPAIPSPPRFSPVGYSLSATLFFCRIFSVRHPILLLPDTFCPPPRCPRLRPAAHSPFKDRSAPADAPSMEVFSFCIVSPTPLLRLLSRIVCNVQYMKNSHDSDENDAFYKLHFLW